MSPSGSIQLYNCWANLIWWDGAFKEVNSVQGCFIKPKIGYYFDNIFLLANLLDGKGNKIFEQMLKKL
jgi:hypothetical protein